MLNFQNVSPLTRIHRNQRWMCVKLD